MHGNHWESRKELFHSARFKNEKEKEEKFSHEFFTIKRKKEREKKEWNKKRRNCGKWKKETQQLNTKKEAKLEEH